MINIRVEARLNSRGNNMLFPTLAVKEIQMTIQNK